MENQNSEAPKYSGKESPEPFNKEGAVGAEETNKEPFFRKSIQNINADSVTLRQGAVQTVKSDRMTIRQGGVLNSTSEAAEFTGSAVGLARSQTARFTTSTVAGAFVRGDAVFDQSASRVVAVLGEVRMDQSVNVLTVTRSAKLDNSNIVFLLAQKTEGPVNPVFGPKESIAFGAVAGIVAGLFFLVSRIIRLNGTKPLKS